MTHVDPSIVRRQIVVDVPIDPAFEVFTSRFGDFKPQEHNLLGSPITETIVERVASVKQPAGAIVHRDGGVAPRVATSTTPGRRR